MLKISNDGTIKLTRGDTAILRFDLSKVSTDGENEIETDYEIAEDDTLTFTVKKNSRSSEACISISVIGENVIRIAPEDTSSLDFGKYVYDFQIDTADGDVYTPIEASAFVLLEEVTS